MKKGFFQNEVVPVTITGKKGESTIVNEDEDYQKVKIDKMSTLKPAFDKNGTFFNSFGNSLQFCNSNQSE
jgi:acetyl-CoA C-acetyltransferase